MSQDFFYTVLTHVKSMLGTYQYLSLSQNAYLTTLGRVADLMDRLARYSPEEAESPATIGNSFISFVVVRFATAMRKLDDRIATLKANAANGTPESEPNLSQGSVEPGTVFNVPNGILPPQKNTPSGPRYPMAQFLNWDGIPPSIKQRIGRQNAISTRELQGVDDAILIRPPQAAHIDPALVRRNDSGGHPAGSGQPFRGGQSVAIGVPVQGTSAQNGPFDRYPVMFDRNNPYKEYLFRDPDKPSTNIEQEMVRLQMVTPSDQQRPQQAQQQQPPQQQSFSGNTGISGERSSQGGCGRCCNCKGGGCKTCCSNCEEKCDRCCGEYCQGLGECLSSEQCMQISCWVFCCPVYSLLVMLGGG